MSKFTEVKNKQVVLLDNLREFLYTNRGRCTTKESDDGILEVVKTAFILGYNERFHEEEEGK